MNNKKKVPLIISFEGNIGAGKTTCLKAVSKELEQLGEIVHIVDEPIPNADELKRFYENPTEYSFSIQCHFINQWMKNLEFPDNASIILMDRSLHSVAYFSRVLQSQDYLTKYQVDCLESMCLHNYFLTDKKPQLIINLVVPTKQCLKNIKTRKRPGEELISDAYLKKLQYEINNHITNAAAHGALVYYTSNNDKSYVESMVAFILSYKKIIKS